jgi:hypothetical protein
MTSFVQADTTIEIINQCSEGLTACQTDNVVKTTTCYVLQASSGTQTIDVGTVWLGGVIWAFPASEGTDNNTGVLAKPQADLAEFTINDNNSGQDSYDLSVVNAYNLAMEITVTSIASGVTPSGTTCEPITCSITESLSTFCQSPNTLTGAPGDGCYNHDGPPATSPTPGTQQFDTVCPNAITYSTDTTGKVYGCPTTSTYSVIFCP